jgi:putative ABC transport system permease protein
MKVFIKYVLKSMTEKKGRFFLLIAAISISTALLTASMGIIDIILDSLAKPMIEANENKDIIIHSTDESSVFYSDKGINASGIDKNSVLKELYIDGQIIENLNTEDEVMHKVAVRGRNMQDVNDDIIVKGNLKDFKGESCIISDRTAKKKNLKIGDSLEIIIGGMTKKLKIKAISGPSGVFYSDTDVSFTVLIPYEYLSKDFKEEGKYNLILANTSEETVEEGIDKFNNNNTLFTAEQLSDKDTVKEQLSGFTSILYVMLIVVAAMSAIIIYSSFRLIITERLSTIGTFLSQGSTVGKVKFILYLESFFYGMIGALFGNALGILGLNIINRLVSPLKDYGIFSKVDIKPIYLIAGTLFAVTLSIVSAFFPIRKISKLQIKNIILNDVRISKSIGWRKFIIGATILGVSIVIYLAAQSKLGLYSALLMIASLSGIILAYPKLIDILSKWLFRILRGKSRNVLYAINNLRTSKILLGNISLIIISLTSIIIITSMGKSMIDIVTQSYTDMIFDIEISNISTIREYSEETTADYLVRELKKRGVDEREINLMSDQFGEITNPNTNKTMSIFVIVNIGVWIYTCNKY